jgi:hypothetical protein
MDGSRFDRLSKRLVNGSSRRATLRALAAAAFATGLTRLGLAEASAKCVQIGKKCKSKHGRKKCCGGAKCKGKKCRCPEGTIACNGECLAAECCSDADCAPDGAPGGQCANGTCHFPPICLGSTGHCSTNAQCCSGSCVLPDTEICAKSAIGEPCHVDSDCISGSCVLFLCEHAI